MSSRRMVLALALGSAHLAGCSTPFAQNTAIDWTKRPGAGTITVSAPKMYRREALINERNQQIAWLNEQLDQSKTLEFRPEIVRELETISSLSAALGLSFDPAAGLNYRRANETGSIQQEINTLKLQLQLDQLKRDAEVVRQKMAAQTEPVNEGLSAASGGDVAPAIAQAAGSVADQLKASIDRMNALTSRLDVESNPVGTAGTSINPADTFRDRSAQWDLLVSAKNAASLDELHDLGGAALIRLNFEATVIPEKRYARSPGVIQMAVVRPTLGDDELEQIYVGWLDHINKSLNLRAGRGWRSDPRVLKSAAAENFETLSYRYGAIVDGCIGPVILDQDVPEAAAKCGLLTLAMPRFVGSTPGEGAYQSYRTYLQMFMSPSTPRSGRSESEEIKADVDARQLMSRFASNLSAGCGRGGLGELPAEQSDSIGQLDRALLLARIRVAAGEALQQAVRVAESMLMDRRIDVPASTELDLIWVRLDRAKLLLASFEKLSGFDQPRCQSEARAFRAARPLKMIPAGFHRALTDEDAVSVYEVGPREQVQQVSTVARAANSLALAVSLAASAPGSGVAGNVAAGYSRQAIGKAAQLERLPAVVGFANKPANAFGWVLGPRATVDPTGRLVVEHSLRPQNLSVDLAVPGWWPRFTLRSTVGWAPSPADIASGSISGVVSDLPVRMSPNSADYAAITSIVARNGIGSTRQVRILDADGLTVSACRPTTILLKGDHIWRSKTVLIGGHRIEGAAVSIGPHMSGLLIDVPALGNALGDAAADPLPITVLTPYGDASAEIHYEAKPTSGCKAGNAAATPKTGPAVSGVMPLRIRAPADVEFTVTGSDLGEIDRVTLNAQPAKPKAASDGKSLAVTFTAGQTASLPISRSNRLILYKGRDVIDEKMIEVTGDQVGP